MAIKYRDIGFVADTSSFDYDECIDQALGSLHDEGRYRVFTDLARRAGQFPRAWDHSGVTPRERLLSGAQMTILAWVKTPAS